MRAAFPGWAEPFMRPAAYKSVYGGRGSGKSHCMAQILVLLVSGRLAARGYPPRAYRVMCARAFAEAIEESVYTVIKHYIGRLGLDGEFVVHAEDIWHRPTGSQIMFAGTARHPEHFKSVEGLDIIWFEQAEQLTQSMMDVILPSVRKRSAERWFTWNPAARSDWTFQRFVLHPRPGDVTAHVNWRDNPWWDDTGLEELRRDTEIHQPELYAWMWEGRPLDTAGANVVLPYETLRKCVDAYSAGLAPDMGEQAVTYGGLDLAEGGADRCALVIRRGPTVDLVEQWPGVAGDLSVAAAHAFDLARPYQPLARLYYDASSPAKTDLVRAGFVGVRSVNFGGAVGGADKLYETKRTNGEVFALRNMQMAEALRLRANRTVRLVSGDDTVDPTRCLFINSTIPQLEAVLADWSQPIRRFNILNGKWQLEKDPENERSPDRFDGLSLAFAVETDNRGLRYR